MNAVLKYASLVKFAHTVFAMPFAMVGFVYGLRYAPLHNPRWPYIVLVQVILCMVFARNAAMGFNRWADRRIDCLLYTSPSPRDYAASRFFFNDTATTEIYTRKIVGSVRCV